MFVTEIVFRAEIDVLKKIKKIMCVTQTKNVLSYCRVHEKTFIIK